jgi:hypothetical protein
MEICAHGEQARHRIKWTVTNGVIPALDISHGDEFFHTASTIVALLVDPRLEHR